MRQSLQLRQSSYLLERSPGSPTIPVIVIIIVPELEFDEVELAEAGVGAIHSRKQVDATGMTMSETLDIAALRSVIRDAKEIAKRYRNLTGKPLGITGEVREFTAPELMNLRLTGARQPGYNY